MNARRVPSGTRRQRGIAAILMIILIALALITVIGMVFTSARNAQERSVSLHAVTPAQGAAWAGLDVVRRYLHDVQPATIEAWINAGTPPSAASPMNLALTGLGNVRNVQVTGIRETNAAQRRYDITVRVDGIAGTGAVGATSPVEAVFSVRLPPPTATPAGAPPIVVAGNVDLTGDLDFRGQPDAAIGVIGNVNIHDVSISGLVDVKSTGTVDVNSAVELDLVHANGDVNLRQGSDAALVKARGNVLISGGGRQGTIESNADVRFESGHAMLVKSRGSLTTGVWNAPNCEVDTTNASTGTYIATVRSMGPVHWCSRGGGSRDLETNGSLVYWGQATDWMDPSNPYHETQILKAADDILLQSNVSPYGSYWTQKTLTVDSTAWTRHKRNAADTGPDTAAQFCADNIELKHETAANPFKGWYRDDGDAPFDFVKHAAISSVDALKRMSDPSYDGSCNGLSWPAIDHPVIEPYTVTTPRIDVTALKASANYVIRRDGNLTRVSVVAVNSVPDGDYVLGWNAEGRQDWLCAPADIDASSASKGDGQKMCRNPIKRICGGDGWTSCLKYTAGPIVYASPLPPGPSSSAAGTWELGGWNGPSMARGVVYFEGDLKINVKAYVNTFLATHDIMVTGTDTKIWAPNAAEFAKLCQNAPIPTAGSGTVSASQVSYLANLYPTNLCGTTDIIPTPIGNVSLIAGSYDDHGEYHGGKISVDGIPAEIMGNIMAGKSFVSTSHTTVTGTVVGGGAGLDPLDPSQLGMDVNNTFKLKKAEWTHNGLPPPVMSNNNAQLRWMRYR